MTIEESAGICRQSFNKCLAYFDMLSPKQQSAIEDQLGRFSIWAFSIGVFASYRASLDYRLRGVDEIQRLIRRLLQTLDEHIQQYLSYLRPLDIDSTTNESRQNSITSAINNDLDSAIGDISEEIGLLHQLSNTIRKASRETHTLKAATSFVIRDEEGNDYGSAFRDLFALELIHWRFPECDETIRQRLAAAMLLRRKRILYRRSRYGGYPSSNVSSSVPKQEDSNTEQARNTTQDAQNDNIDESIPELRQKKSDDKSQTNTATTLHMEQWKRASTPSVISRPNTIRLSNQERLEFPPSPKGPILKKLRERKEYWIAKHDEELSSLDNYLGYKQRISDLPPETDYDTWRQNHISDLNDELEERIENDRDACYKGNMEVICPYCCCMLSSAIVMNDHRWIDHVKHDLDPYVCLFKTCDTPDILYNHSQDWLKHMRQHKSRQWRCAAKSHGVLLFEDQIEYEEHMRTKHKNTESQLSMLVERGSRSSGPIFKFCPLCGTSDYDASVEEHIAIHLRYLALKSLPFTDDGEGEEGSSKAAIISEKEDRQSQGTIVDDPDYGTSLNFEDTDSTPMPYDDEHESLHIPEEHPQDVPLRTDSDGIRKKNARFDIPAERTLSNIEEMIAQSTKEDEIKELKQQKRLLRNRQAALDSLQRKKLHTEELEEEKKQFATVINDPKEAFQAEAQLSGAALAGPDDADDLSPDERRKLAIGSFSRVAVAGLVQRRNKSKGLDYAQEVMGGIPSDRVAEDLVKDESPSSPQAEESSPALPQRVPASSTRRTGEMVPAGISTSEIGAVDAPPPHQPRVLAPPPPNWLMSGLEDVKGDFPDGRFTALMLYAAFDISTMMPVVATNTDYPNPKLKYQFLPRIQCLDCPEELHVPGPGMSVRNFKMHLEESQHTQRLEERVKDEAEKRSKEKLAKRRAKGSQTQDEEAKCGAEKYEALAQVRREYQAERLKRQNTPTNDMILDEKDSDQPKIEANAAKEPVEDQRVPRTCLSPETLQRVLTEVVEQHEQENSEGVLKDDMIPSEIGSRQPMNFSENILPVESIKPSEPNGQRPLPEPEYSNLALNWSSQDDVILLNARSQGDGWAKIQREKFPNKTANSCRKRHELLDERYRTAKSILSSITNAHRPLTRNELLHALSTASGDAMDSETTYNIAATAVATEHAPQQAAKDDSNPIPKKSL
ncbi:hypothetical protein DPV78_003647 [Talaromyces pinophilus]|nr:hypothetical protein DPV78_003647 [Talaromyces pinophilus]